MIKPETSKLLEEMGKGPYGVALREVLEEELKEIGDIQKATSWDDTLARQKSTAALKKIFSFLNKTTPRIDKPKDNYR